MSERARRSGKIPVIITQAGEPPPPPSPPGELLPPSVPPRLLETLSPSPPESAAKPKHRRISAKVLRALNAYVHKASSITEAAEIAGMSREGFSRALAKDHIKAELDRIMSETTRTRGLKALKRLDHLVDGARSEYVQLEAAKSMADRAGYVPPKVQTPMGDTTLIVNIKLD